MNKKIFILIFILFSLVNFSSCNNTLKYIDRYTGTYVVEANYHKEYHVYWGSEKITKDVALLDYIFTLEILSDGKAIAKYPSGEETIGKVRCNENTISFRDIPYISNYKFTYVLKNSHRYLDYSYTKNGFGLEYDYYSERLTFIDELEDMTSKKEIITLPNTYARCSGTIFYENYQTDISSNNNYNNLTNSSIELDFINNKFTLFLGKEKYEGNIIVVDLDKKQYRLSFNNKDIILIPEGMIFTYYQGGDDWIYFKTYDYEYTYEEQFDNYRKETYFSIAYAKKV